MGCNFLFLCILLISYWLEDWIFTWMSDIIIIIIPLNNCGLYLGRQLNYLTLMSITFTPVWRAAFSLNLNWSHCWHVHSWDFYLTACVLGYLSILSGETNSSWLFGSSQDHSAYSCQGVLFPSSIVFLDIFIDWY